jgi:hypothetical protein
MKADKDCSVATMATTRSGLELRTEGPDAFNAVVSLPAQDTPPLSFWI